MLAHVQDCNFKIQKDWSAWSRCKNGKKERFRKSCTGRQEVESHECGNDLEAKIRSFISRAGNKDVFAYMENMAKKVLQDDILPDQTKRIDTKLAQMKSEFNTKLAQMNNRFNGELLKKDQEIRVQAKKIRTLESTIGPQVVFSTVRKSYSGFNHVKPGQVIRFTELVANVGRGMNARAGIFTVPVSGLWGCHSSAALFDRILYASAARR